MSSQATHEPHSHESQASQESLSPEDVLASQDGSPAATGDDAQDYSTLMEAILGNEGGDLPSAMGQPKDSGQEEDEEEFVYEGVDAEPQRAYGDQLRDILGAAHEEDELDEGSGASKPILSEFLSPAAMHSTIQHTQRMSSTSPIPGSATSASPPSTPVMSNTNGTPRATPTRNHRSFVHPTISRLRSFTPRPSSVLSGESIGSNAGRGIDGHSPAPSHFSAISCSSSLANLHDGTEERNDTDGRADASRDVFKWTRLRTIEESIFASHSQKAAALLGAPLTGSPTVLAANGFICVGTEGGHVFVFDFKQMLKCTCGTDESVKAIGSVTAVALSHDHTFLVSGHERGHILLYDLHKPAKPVRMVSPTTMSAVLSGRQEGHLMGSRIVSVGFVAGRHSTIVSADDAGLAFHHSLGKVLFVEASDTLRILGKYPEGEQAAGSTQGLFRSLDGPSRQVPEFRKRRERRKNPILALSPLPLGTAPHPTDMYNVVAILTPIKLVVVGLRPSPKTWYRRHRDEQDEEKTPQSRWKGTMAWFPIMQQAVIQEPKTKSKNLSSGASRPLLVYSWANTLRTLQVSVSHIKEQVANPRTGKITEVDVGVLSFEEGLPWRVGGEALGVQWLNINQIVVLVANFVEVYDVNTRQLVERSEFAASLLVNPWMNHATSGAFQYSGSLGNVSHSLRVYKGKLFTLGVQEVQVGTLLTWADRILGFVENGDFLSAINLTRTYYENKAPGNRNGLPSEQEALREVVGSKMRELMAASSRYTFSEERLTDATHITPDGRGVDRTSLFEDLVTTCAQACITLDDYDFLFEDLFHYYDSWGIASIFLQQLEPFILDGQLREVPPRITQRLIAMHDNRGEPTRAERVIWRIAPECLDINQAIHLCQTHHLYDALVYVYTQALHDFVSPIVNLLELLRKVQQYRRARTYGLQTEYNDETVEPLLLNGYKLFSYLAAVLSGLAYPSEEPMDTENAFNAKRDVYSFLFFGRSIMWPPGDKGHLILTCDEEGGPEPTYPYLRLLLRFDTEAFLHALDIAFENSYLNDETQGVTRLVIVKVLLEVLSDPDLTSPDITLVNIFIAKNVPKYPQFIQMTPSALHRIAVDLAEDPDGDTREDRQLAAEYLLSTFTPHQTRPLLKLFEEAGFYRILRSWHRHELQWAPLVQTYLHDPGLRSIEVFAGIEETLTRATSKKRSISPELLDVMSKAVPILLRMSVPRTALLLDQRLPELHDTALQLSAQNTDERRFQYLRYLLAPASLDETDFTEGLPPRNAPSSKLSKASKQEFIYLHCRFDPAGVKNVLTSIPADWVDWQETINVCERYAVYEALLWALDHVQGPKAAVAKYNALASTLCTAIINELAEMDHNTSLALPSVQIFETAVRATDAVCRTANVQTDDAENLWFRLLDAQLRTIERTSAARADLHDDVTKQAMNSLRLLFQETFSSLMGVAAPQGLSLPRLFKRLIDSASSTPVAKGSAYSEFREIMMGMLESYRSEGDLLIIAKRLLQRDVFQTMETLWKVRGRGWAPSKHCCAACREKISVVGLTDGDKEGELDAADQIVISRTGALYHARCFAVS